MSEVPDPEPVHTQVTGPGAVLESIGDGSVTAPLPHHEIDGLTPGTVFVPGSAEALCAALVACSSERLAAVPIGGGTRISIGETPERYDVAIRTAGLADMVAHNHADLTATVQAGVTISALQAALARHGQFVSIDTPLPDRATVGGTLALGTSGPSRWHGWGIRDVVIGMKVASPQGELTSSGGQVVKNVSGYDMSRMHIGGLGTLGVIAEISLKLTPLPAGQATMLASFRRPADAFAAGKSIFHGLAWPLATTLLSPVAAQKLRLVRKGSHHLAVRVHGRPGTLARMVDEISAACRDNDPLELDRLDGDDHEGIWRAIADFGWDEATRPTASLRISLPPAAAGDVLASLESAGAARGLLPAVVAHVAYGSVLLHLYSPSPQADTGTIAQVIADARRLSRQRRGSAVLEQASPEVKRGIDVWDGAGEALSVMRRLKDQYDPQRVLNPGRFVGGI